LTDLNEQLQVNLQINEAIRARNELLNHNSKQLKSQIDLAWELCSAMECGENIDELKGKILSTREAIGSLSASAEKAAGQTRSMNKATAESATIFQKAGNFIKTALGYLTGWTLMKKGVEWLRNAFASIIPTIKNLSKNIFNFARTAVSAIGRMKENLIEMSYRLGQITEYTRALERIRDKFGDLEKGTSKILKDSLRPMRSEFNQLTASGVTFSAVFGRGPDGMAKAIEFNAELMERLNGGTKRLREEIGQNIAAMAIYRKGMGFTAEQQATLVALADSQGKNIVKVQHEYAKFSLEMGKRFGLDSKVIGRAMADMTANVGDFGTLSTKQLAQVAVYTQKLGIETKALQGVIKKYDDFESAAKSAAMLNQTFGMQVDVLKLLKDEDPASRLNQLQRSFQATGRSYDQLSRAERRRLAELSGLDDKSAALAFSQNGLSMSYEEVQAAGEETEDKFKDLNETLKELSKNIAKNFYDPNKYKSFFEAFLGGFNRGIELSGPFMQVMRNIQRSLRIVEMAGFRLGKVFVDVFPGVKQLFEGLAKYFDPATASSRMNQVIGTFTKFFQTLQKGPEHVRQAMIDLWNSLTKDYFKIFSLSGSGSKKMMLEGFSKILVTATNVFLSFAEIIVREVAKGIRMVIGLFTKDSKQRNFLSEMFKGMGSGPSIDWKGLFGDSLGGLKDAFTKDLWPALKDFGKLMWKGLKDGFFWLANKIDAWLTETFTWWPTVKTTLSNFYSSIEKWFLDMVDSVKDFFAPLIAAYKEYGWETAVTGGESQGLKSKLEEKFGFVFDFFGRVKQIYEDFKKAWEDGGWFTKGVGNEADKGLQVEIMAKLNNLKDSIANWLSDVFMAALTAVKNKLAQNPKLAAGVAFGLAKSNDVGFFKSMAIGGAAFAAAHLEKRRLIRNNHQLELQDLQEHHQKMADEFAKDLNVEAALQEEMKALQSLNSRNLTNEQKQAAIEARANELTNLKKFYEDKADVLLRGNNRIAAEEMQEAALAIERLRRNNEEMLNQMKKDVGAWKTVKGWGSSVLGFFGSKKEEVAPSAPSALQPQAAQPTPYAPTSMMLADYHDNKDSQTSNIYSDFVSKLPSPDKIKEAESKVSIMEQMKAMINKIMSFGSVEKELDDAIKTLPDDSKMSIIKEKLSQVVTSFNGMMSSIGEKMSQLSTPSASLKSIDASSLGAVDQIVSLNSNLLKIAKDGVAANAVNPKLRQIKLALQGFSAHWNGGKDEKDKTVKGIKEIVEEISLDETAKNKFQEVNDVLSTLKVAAETLLAVQNIAVHAGTITANLKAFNTGIKAAQAGIKTINTTLTTDKTELDFESFNKIVSPLNTIHTELTKVSSLELKTEGIKGYVKSVNDSLDVINPLLTRFGTVLPTGIAATAQAIAQEIQRMDESFKRLSRSDVIATAIKIGDAFNGSTNGTLTFKHENLSINLAVKVEMSAEQIAQGVINVQLMNPEDTQVTRIQTITTDVKPN
jgi:hypothetical protein